MNGETYDDDDDNDDVDGENDEDDKIQKDIEDENYFGVDDFRFF